MLEDALFDSSLKLEPWEPSKRTLALKSLVDALPQIKTGIDLDDVTAFVLQAEGGGCLKLAVPRTSAIVDVCADRRADGSGSSCSFGGNVSPATLAAAAEESRRALRERYPELR